MVAHIAYFLDGLRKCPSESKIRQFEQSVFRDENVSGLHVTMQYFVAVNVIEAVEQLLHDFFNFPQIEFDVDVAQESGEIVVAEIEDEIEGAFGTIVLRGFRAADFLQVDDVLVLEQLQNLNLSQRRDGETLLFVFHQHFFQGHEGPRFFVSGLEYFAKSSLTDFCQFFVLDGHIVTKGIFHRRFVSRR